jgi:hypothetical protein
MPEYITLSGAYTLGWATGLTHKQLTWLERLPETNTLAYSQFTYARSFTTLVLGSGGQRRKRFLMGHLHWQSLQRFVSKKMPELVPRLGFLAFVLKQTKEPR